MGRKRKEENHGGERWEKGKIEDYQWKRRRKIDHKRKRKQGNRQPPTLARARVDGREGMVELETTIHR